ncbi:hypothetical protein G7085_01230 [Tessaracoccus sp. HDW20]|nr:hypothetical protein [Tessaracoccus coleopterorum]
MAPSHTSPRSTLWSDSSKGIWAIRARSAAGRLALTSVVAASRPRPGRSARMWSTSSRALRSPRLTFPPVIRTPTASCNPCRTRCHTKVV